MFETFPTHYEHIAAWEWSQFEPYAADLRQFELSEKTVDEWLRYETHFFALIEEWRTRLNIRFDKDTSNSTAQQQFNRYNRQIQPHLDQLRQDLIQKLLAADLRPANYDIPLRHLRADAGLYLHNNSEFNHEIQQLFLTYQQISSSQTIEVDGIQKPISQLFAAMNTPDRLERKKLYDQIQARRAEDRPHFDSIWSQLMMTRKQIVVQSGVSNYRDLCWRQLKRFDYTPRDVMALCSAIEKVVVPLLQRRHEQQRKRLKVDSLQPWDVPYDAAAIKLQPYQTFREFLDKAEQCFTAIDKHFGDYFKIMRRENLIDIEAHPDKSPNSYVVPLAYSKRPFIFSNMTGTHADVERLVHESGHAFHIFESAKWAYLYQRQTSDEINEMAAMTLQMLALDHYNVFYANAEAVRYARIQHLENVLRYWIDAAMTASFQQWVYTYHDAATDAACCDAKWRELLLRYFPGVDFRGLEHEMLAPWWHNHRIFFTPFYAIEYAIAQLGAVQIWQNSRQNRRLAMKHYRAALALGNTKSLPELYQAAGAKLAFDEVTLQQAVDAIEIEILALEA